MPSKQRALCNEPGCKELATHGTKCEKHAMPIVSFDFTEQKRKDRERYSKWYSKEPWKSIRKRHLLREPFCRECGNIATVVDHIAPHEGDWELFTSKANLQSLCKRCHDRKTFLYDGALGNRKARVGAKIPNDLKPSFPSLTVVCGPPGSGKSTYVRENARPNDLIIDLDVIISELSHEPIYQASDEYIEPALAIRNRILYSLNTDFSHQRAWFVISGADKRQRDAIRRLLQPLKIIVLETQIGELKMRIEADDRRGQKKEAHLIAAESWWERYERDGRDIIIT